MNDIAKKVRDKVKKQTNNYESVKKVSDKIEVEGKIAEVLKGQEYLVELPNKHTVKAHVSGKMRMNNIRILLGDTVTVELTPYDLTRGIITWNKR